MAPRKKNPFLDVDHSNRNRRGQPCQWPGCGGKGDHRAPKSREHLRDFYWFCTTHVREYNLNWDFFNGMSADEIDAYMREDVTWHRPTWKAGSRWGSESTARRFQDAFEMFSDGGGGFKDPNEKVRRKGPKTKAEEMLAILDLDMDATTEDIRVRYKELAKKHHPDLNNGDPRSEEKFKAINEAYDFLIRSSSTVLG